jgi:hypothetical protein
MRRSHFRLVFRGPRSLSRAPDSSAAASRFRPALRRAPSLRFECLRPLRTLHVGQSGGHVGLSDLHVHPRAALAQPLAGRNSVRAASQIA